MIKVIGLNIKVLKKEPFSGSHQGMHPGTVSNAGY